jgi:NAD-dependent dihydropyrimidine dehydrogenase PreA subunit
MPHPIINTDECTGCGICVDTCTQDVLDIVRDVATVINEDSCTGCGECMEECPMGAIEDIEED